jgi:tetratricopeptide (TPR) repeat protein
LFRSLVFLSIIFSLTIAVSCNRVSTKDRPLAKVGDTYLYESEMEFAIASMPPFRQNMMKEPQHRRELFENLLQTRVYSVAGQKWVRDTDGKIGKLIQNASERDLARIYQQIHIGQNLGLTEKELASHYKANKARFQDSLAQDFESVRAKVAEDLYIQLNEPSFREFFEKNKMRFADKNSAEVSFIQHKQQVVIQEAHKKLLEGVSFEEVAKKYSEDSISATNGGNLGWIRQGEYRKEFSRLRETNSLLFDESTRLKPGAVSDVLSYEQVIPGSNPTDTPEKRSEKVFVILKINQIKDAKPMVFEEAKDKLASVFIGEQKQEMSKSILDKLKVKYSVKLEEIKPPDALDFYEKNKEKYLTAKSYELWHIENIDSVKLSALAPTLSAFEDFKNAAKSNNANPFTKATEGALGRVKHSHSLPFGIGMMPSLFRVLEGQAPGLLPGVIKAPDAGTFHLFWLEKSYAQEQKPFDRVQKVIETELLQSGEIPLDSNTLLATVGKKKFYEKDVLELAQEVPPRQRKDFPRPRLLEFLIEWEVLSQASVEVGLDQSKDFKALRALRKADIWAKIFQDSVLIHNYGVTQSVLKQVWQQNKFVFEDRPFEEIQKDVALFHLIPELAFRAEYALNSAKYQGELGYKAHLNKIFKNIRMKEEKGVRTRTFERIKSDVRVKILDKSLVVEGDVVEATIAEAKEFYKNRKMMEAKASYERVRELYPENNEAVFKATMGLAQILMEEERFDNSAEEYRYAARVFPENPEAYKALFMKGFIYAEHLKNNDKALPVFKEVLAKWPNCDLAESADWMVRNIESGGQLMPKFIDSLENTTPKQ